MATDALPDHPAIAVRHTLQQRQQTRARRFSPVAVPGDTRRQPVGRLLASFWRALVISGCLTLFLFSAASCGALMVGVGT